MAYLHRLIPNPRAHAVAKQRVRPWALTHTARDAAWLELLKNVNAYLSRLAHKLANKLCVLVYRQRS